MRYCRRFWGVGIYSIGLDRKDNGDDLHNPTPGEPSADVGVRLWELKLRRLPPPAEQSLDELPGEDDE